MSGLDPSDLSPERAFTFRLTHLANLSWIAENGLHCQSSSRSDPNFVPIGLEDEIQRRSQRSVPAPPRGLGGTLSDYVPFYFTPWSVMQLNVVTGTNVPQRSPEELAFVVTSLPVLEKHGVEYVITDRHARSRLARYATGRERLETMVPWESLRQRNFKKDPDNPEPFDRYRAEALVHKHLPTRAVLGFACYTERVQSRLAKDLADKGVKLHVAVRKGWYF